MADIINATIEEIQINVTLEGAIIEQQGGGGGITDGDKGDILVSGGGATWTIENMSENATVTTGTYVSNVNQALLIKARKSTAGTITKGQVVYIVGSTGSHLTVELARADVEATSAYTIGIAATTITGSADGFIMQYGRLSGLSTLPTATFSDGDAIYLSEATAGGYRVGAPTAPNHGVLLGFVIRASNGSAGEIDVRIQNYQEFDELSDVNIVSETSNDFIIRNATNTRWENITPANVKTVLAINNVDNTSDLNKPISTATQTALNTKQNTITNSDSITQGSTNLFLTSAERTKLTNTSGTNSGDNAVNSLYSGLVSNATHTGDATGATALTLATVNSNVGSFTNANITVNAKGLITAASNGSGGGGLTDGDKGDITVSGTGTVWTIDNNVVANAKLAQMATKTYKGRTTAGTGDPEDVSVATLKTDLSLDNVDNTSDATKNSASVALTNKTIALGSNTVSGTLAEFNTALTGADFATGGGTASGTNTGDQNTFSTIAVSGQSNVVADTTSDTLTLIAGSNITLTTNATNDEITIASTGGGGGFTYPQLLSAISLRI